MDFEYLWGSNLSCYQTRIKDFPFHQEMVSPASVFYSKASPCPLPVSSLTSVLKSSKISGNLLSCDSQDPLVQNCIPQLKTGPWHIEEAVATTKSDIKNKLISGYYRQFLDARAWVTPLVRKFLVTSPLSCTINSFKVITKKMMTPIPFVKQWGCKFKVNKLSG